MHARRSSGIGTRLRVQRAEVDDGRLIEGGEASGRVADTTCVLLRTLQHATQGISQFTPSRWSIFEALKREASTSIAALPLADVEDARMF